MSQTSAMASTDIRRSIEEVDRRFMDAFNAGDFEGACRAVYTADAQVLPQGGETIQGMDNLIQFWKATAEQLAVERVELSSVEVQPMGEMAYQIGRAVLTMGGGQRAEGKYVVIWKQEDGQWKWHIDIFNFNA